MAEIIFRLPSKKIQYGYVEVHATPDELGLNLSDAVDLGVVYSNYAASFMEGEVMGVDAARASRGLPPKVEGQKPTGKPVEGVSGVSQVLVDFDPQDPDGPGEAEAAEILKRELGATEIKEHAVGDTVEVGGTKFTKHSPAPWERDVAPKTKPWDPVDTMSVVDTLPTEGVDLGNLF